MKTIYINKSILENNEFKKSVLINALPDSIVSKIITNRTSLGNNPSIPDIFDEPFLLKLINNGFEDTKKVLKEIGEISDVDSTDIEEVLAKLIKRCKEIEKPYRSELERICLNYVIDLFEIPEETVDIFLSLVNNVDTSDFKINIDSYDGDNELESIDNAITIKGEVYKRRLLNSLCIGASMRMSSDLETYISEINKIDNRLGDLYHKIIALNNYILYTKDDFGIDERNIMQLGIVELKLGREDEKPQIKSQGVIFPILLSETIRGFMELFISHGLPKDIDIAKIVMEKSDFLKAEPWDMKIGPQLWDILSSSFNDIDSNELPYLFKRISELKVDTFNNVMKEVFAKTKKGKRIMSKISFKAKRDIEYDKFVDKMTKMKTDKGIITDDYIHPDEL
jgi:chorismate mutase